MRLRRFMKRIRSIRLIILVRLIRGIRKYQKIYETHKKHKVSSSDHLLHKWPSASTDISYCGGHSGGVTGATEAS
jgi:hypothetical protein